MHKISLITTTYNSAKTVSDTLKSINMQTYPDVEHIVVDGASKDETLAVVKRDGKRVSKLVSEPDKGFYDAYNKGLALATGEIIGFLNSDDFYCSTTVLERVAKAFADDPALEACYSDLVYVDRQDTGKIMRLWKSRPYREGAFATGFVPAHPTLFLRKSVYDRAGGFNISYRFSADYEFMLRVFHQYHVKSLYIPGIIVKMRAGGTTGGPFRDIVKQNDEILRAMTDQGIAYNKVTYYLRKVIDRTIQKIRGLFVSQHEMVNPA